MCSAICPTTHCPLLAPTLDNSVETSVYEINCLKNARGSELFARETLVQGEGVGRAASFGGLRVFEGMLISGLRGRGRNPDAPLEKSQ